MRNNEIISVKARFGTLYNAKLSNTVFKGVQKYVLKDLIFNKKHRNENLFLAMGQGLGKFCSYANAVINPKVKDAAKMWLHNEHLFLIFSNRIVARTSVIVMQNKVKEKYDEDLRNFLAPKLSNKQARKNKRHKMQFKAHGQALGREV